MNKEKPKIFLSYAHEDIAMAKRLYQDLKRYGLDVWIDCENLLPGQNWKITIEKNIRQSQYYLLLLSSHSMSKRGFIQKEMKIAYEVLENCSEDDIYLIPVRLNECEPSFKISDIQYIDVFPENEYQNGLKKILQAICKEALLLRSKPKVLSRTDASNVILKFDFFDYYINPEGKRIEHDYRLKEINCNKVVFDETTGLIWQQSGSEEINFEDAKKYIKEINDKRFADVNDWRLPTLEEAMSLVEPKPKNRLYIDPIFDSKQDWIWTADQVKGESWAWVVSFDYGMGDHFGRATNYVRAVRSRQSSTEKFDYFDLSYLIKLNMKKN